MESSASSYASFEYLDGPDDPRLPARHKESVKNFPEIKLLSTEYVIISARKSNWGEMRIKIRTILAIIAVWVFSMIVMFSDNSSGANIFIILICLIMSILLFIIGSICIYVFRKNLFIVTNERIHQRIQITPFDYRIKNIELKSVKDCSFSQYGITQKLFNYGDIRISMVGDEETNVIGFIDKPEEQLEIINSTVQAATSYRIKRKRSDLDS
jgi:hypothetical protein